MKWFVELPQADRHAVVTTSGTFAVEDHLRMIEDIVGRPGWRPGTDVLFDHRQLTFGDANFATMSRARSNHLRHDARIGDGKAAILVRSLSDYGRGRQFELLASDSVSAALCVFMDPDEAIGWLADKAA